MKRLISTLSLFFLLCIGSEAQVFIINDNLTSGRMSKVTGAVVDSLTNEPVAFASFYVIPAKDTTISNFTLTDAEGKAKLEDVPYGNYIFRVEMLGYRPYVKEKYFRDREVDMGTIKLRVDEKYLKAAVVTDVGNPIVVKKDTVEFNASSFQVGTNDMLKDLIKRMPGMEITEDGKVKFNGEEIDKLTVGGRTFFFGDQSTALNNLPASIVDKIRVIDRESERTRDTGLKDGEREKVLDVALKKEYEQGWFGNAGIKGGTTMAGGKDDPLRDDRGLLYSGNALVSAYSEKDQLTIIGNGMNITDSDGFVFVVVSGDGSRSRATNIGQIASAGQVGLNLNTSRIKNFETTVGSNYKYGDSRSGSKSFRTTFQDGGDVFSASESSGRGFSNSLSADTEFKKETGKVRVRINPRFSYSRGDDLSSSISETSRGGNILNSTSGDVRDISTSRWVHDNSSITFREIGGKDNRTFSVGLNWSYQNEDGQSAENSLMKMSGSEERRSLKYLNDSWESSLGGSLRYSEPIGEKLTLSAEASLSGLNNHDVRDAFDAAGRNDYYSSESRVKTVNQSYGLTAQYQFSKDTWATIGASSNGILNETSSKSWGIEETTGIGEWYWHLTPRLRFQHSSGMNRYTFNASGSSQHPYSSYMRPTMSVTDPSRPTIGNIYLKPYSNTNYSLTISRNNRTRFSTLMFYLYGSASGNPISYARWYDTDGILYSIPVNSEKSSINGSVYSSYMTPLNPARTWFISGGLGVGVYKSTSYQAKGVLPGIDRDSFDYSSFMETFWGSGEGDLFYSGKSGFSQSSTSTISPDASLTLRYSSGAFSGRVYAGASGRIARYSINPNLNMNTMDNSFGAAANYTTKHEFEFDTDLSYNWYKGYSAGYGTPEWQWNAEISKNIKAFNFSVKIHDILDQTRNLTHTFTANYEEDTYRLVMGRYILFGFKWNFGKMNASHSQRAQSAAMRMVF